MNAADTNILVRIITGDEPSQTAAADRFVEQGAWVSILAIAETTWVLKNAYNENAAGIAAAVDLLLGHTKLVVQDSDAVAAALELFRSRPSLGFSDCLMLQLARKAGHLPLGTFDRALGRAEGATLLR
jgi:predicted nucleic-acid-binding protein